MDDFIPSISAPVQKEDRVSGQQCIPDPAQLRAGDVFLEEYRTPAGIIRQVGHAQCWDPVMSEWMPFGRTTGGCCGRMPVEPALESCSSAWQISATAGKN